ncbi:MAG: Holliday junction resolvase RecU [Mycoplasmoidaceae bacterium]
MQFKNKGMYIEEIINATAKYYLDHELLYLAKRFLPIQITARYDKVIKGVLLDKSTVDYNGIYHGKYFDFETKETSNHYFNLHNIKKHQSLHLDLISKLGGMAFIIICFKNAEDYFFAISNQEIINLRKKKINKIDIKYCLEHFYQLEIVFPGILNLIDFLESQEIKFS